MHLNDIDEYNTSSMVESQGQNEANSTVQPVLDEISDESEPETLYPPVQQIKGPFVVCGLVSTGYKFSQNASLEASKPGNVGEDYQITDGIFV